MTKVQSSWSRKYGNCLKCGTRERPHKSRGYCTRCYDYNTETRQQRHISRKTRKLEKKISIGELKHSYSEMQMSLNDIARNYNCTRQYIHKLMKKYGIKRRNRTQARELALSKGKIASEREDILGNIIKVTHHKHIIDKDFFKCWSPAMAYVLGIIYTDGNLQPETCTNISKIPPRLIVFQKEPELLKKMLALMDSNAMLRFKPKRGIAGAGYYFDIADRVLCEDLIKLGLKPKKSLTLIFPDVEPQYARHFIRGCWDGDGSVYWEGNDPNKPCASFVSGSRLFIERLIEHLVKLGLPDRTIHTDKRRAFYFRYTGVDCAKLYHVLYDGVPEDMYLTRKYERFKAIADYFEKHSQLKLTF